MNRLSSAAGAVPGMERGARAPPVASANGEDSDGARLMVEESETEERPRAGRQDLLVGMSQDIELTSKTQVCRLFPP